MELKDDDDYEEASFEKKLFETFTSEHEHNHKNAALFCFDSKNV